MKSVLERVGRAAAVAAGLALGVTAIHAQVATRSPLADAAMRGDVAGVRTLVAERADVNLPQGDGMTALHWAARRGNSEMASAVLEAGANVKAVTRLGSYTPLHLAAQEGHDGVVRALLARGADADAMTSTGAVPLHFAAASGNVATIALLLDRGANPNAREPQWGQTPLMFAAAAGPYRRREAAGGGRRRPGPHRSRHRHQRAQPGGFGGKPCPQRAHRRHSAAARGRAGGGGAIPRPWRGRAGRAGGGRQRRGQRARTARLRRPGGCARRPDGAAAGRARWSRRDGAGARGVGANINQASAADRTSPLLMATINGHFDLAKQLLDRGADVRLVSDGGATPLYAVLNMQWAPKARHPQPADYMQQQIDYLELARAFLDAGVDVNARLAKSLWYTTYNRDLLGVDRTGATAFWLAAYTLDIPAMKLLLRYGADPNIRTAKVPERYEEGGPDPDAPDRSGLPPVPWGGPAVAPIHAASGVGYGLGFAGNTHRHVPDGWVPAVRFLVEELGADVNARDHNGYTPMHHAASRGDDALIRYFVSKGADPKAVARSGQTTVDLANGPVQRIQPFPETIALLESLGAVNNHRCVSC